MNKALHDTLSISKRLKSAGMNEPQAEAVAGAIHGSIKDATAHLATKKDLGALESRIEARFSTLESGLEARFSTLESGLEARFSTVESRLEAGISGLESRLVWRIFLLFISTAGLAVAILRLFSS